MSKQPSPFVAKLLRIRILLLIGFLFLLFLSIGVFFSIDTGNSKSDKNRDNFYQTWKVLRFYQNGKLVVNDKKFEHLRFRINKDSTAEWIRADNVIKLRAWINEDASKLVKVDDELIEDIDAIYEIKKDKFRFGKRTVESHYEYVMVPDSY